MTGFSNILQDITSTDRRCVDNSIDKPSPVVWTLQCEADYFAELEVQWLVDRMEPINVLTVILSAPRVSHSTADVTQKRLAAIF